MRKMFSHGVYVPSIREYACGAVQQFEAVPETLNGLPHFAVTVSLWSEHGTYHVASLVDGRDPWRKFDSYPTATDGRRAWSRAVTEAKKYIPA